MNTAYLWLILGVALTILEVNTTALVCLWFIIGAVGAFMISLVSDSFLLQVTVFAVASALALVATRPLAKKLTDRKPVATNYDMLIGKVVVVSEDISPVRKGRVSVGGISYLATSDRVIHKDKQVLIISITGNTLIVRPILEEDYVR